MRSKPLIVLLLGVAMAILAVPLGAAIEETPEQRRQRLLNMSAAEKEELIRKKERFEKLPPEEQQRLRSFHEQVSTDPEGDRLRRVMVRYCDWLKTLSSTQRSELERLPGEERVSKIKELMKLQEEESFKRLVKAQLPLEDLTRIFDWIEDYATRQEELLLSRLPRDAQRWIREERDPLQRRFRLRMALIRHGGGQFTAALAEEEEFKRLVSGLRSPEAQKALEAAREPEKKRLLVQEWLKAAVAARTNPPVSDAELQRFYSEELDSARREELELLPREEMQRELRRLYNMQKFRRDFDRPPGDRPPGDRPPGERPPFPMRPPGSRPPTRTGD